jgi:dTDP-D-glucose 4,6-dehydratase
MDRANAKGFYPKVSLEDGIRKTTEWFIENKSIIDNRFNAFTKNKI